MIEERMKGEKNVIKKEEKEEYCLKERGIQRMKRRKTKTMTNGKEKNRTSEKLIARTIFK